MYCKWESKSPSGVFKDHSKMTVEITLEGACDIELFIILTDSREEGMACSEGHTKSPKAQSLVMAGRERAEQGFMSKCLGGVAVACEKHSHWVI